MKNLIALFALCFVLGLAGCTKKEEAPQSEGAAAPQAEGTTSGGTEASAENPPDEMAKKKDDAGGEQK